MKKIYLALVFVVIFAAGFGFGYISSDFLKSRVAVVDIPQVVANSLQVQNLRTEQDALNAELAKWLQDAQKVVDGEKDKEKQAQLLQQYSNEFNNKRNELNQRYTADLQSVDQNINKTIVDVAKSKGYKFIIAKGMIIGGGDDITADVVKVVK